MAQSRRRPSGAGDGAARSHVEDRFDVVWRAEAPHVLAALLRRSADFASCEDAVQEAMLAAARQWGRDGCPDDPRAWLVRVASRRLIDIQRSDAARRVREERDASTETVSAAQAAWGIEADPGSAQGLDDVIEMLLLCAHPALTKPSRVALSLRAVSGLTTEQIAAAFLVPVPTMTRRISRAKAAIAESAPMLPSPDRSDLPLRLDAARHTLLLVFNEGYTRSSGDVLQDVDLAAEAIRLTEIVHANLPSDGETAGLLALMLLTHARVGGRVDHAGELIPLAEQDRSRWDRAMIERGVGLIERALPTGPVGPIQLQAAIAAVHSESATASETDWPQIVELYDMLRRQDPSAVVMLNRAVAIGMAQGPDAGLDAIDALLDNDDLRSTHRLHAAHAHLLELSGRRAEAEVAYRRAASLTASIPEQRYLNRRAAQTAEPFDGT